MAKKVYFHLLLLSQITFAQQKISGVVLGKNNTPLEYVTVTIIDTKKGTFSNEKGNFSIRLPKGKKQILFSSLGYKDVAINVDSLKTNYTIILHKDLLSLDEVVVTATKKYSNEGSSSYKIKAQAIKQVQAMHLGDVLSLLPGNKTEAPDLTKPRVANLREALPSNVNAFGTAVMIDGVALSNDANMQAVNSSIGLSGGKSQVGGGIDLRNISVVNIESVEVVAGVASPKYGNLSSGNIIVKTKSGKLPWTINSNISTTNYQVSAANGVKFSKYGILNTDFSYSYSSGIPTARKLYYQNFNLGLRWKFPAFKPNSWNHFTSFRVVFSDDGLRQEPDEAFKTNQDVKSTSYQLAFSGDLNTKFGKLSYSLSGSLTKQYSFFNGYEKNGPFPIIEAIESGTYNTTFSPTFFNTKTTIEGNPFNFNFRAELIQSKYYKNVDFNFESGIQYVIDDNFGAKKNVEGNVVNHNWALGNRTVNFNQELASKTTSLYHQTSIKYHKNNIVSRLNLGIRYDNMIERYNLFSPRLSASTQINKFNFKAAWGLSYKAPAIAQLYPSKTYIDYSNLIYYNKNPKERLAVVTTYVHKPKNTHLKPSYVNLSEIGADWNSPIGSIQLTYFKKYLKRGLQHTDELLILPKQEYEITATPVDEQPIVAPITGAVANVARTIKKIKNNYFTTTNGVELVFDSKKIEATNTQFNFRYSYLKTFLNDKGYKIEPSSFNVGNSPVRYGVYHKTYEEHIKSFGTLTLIQHIPALRFVLTLSAEFSFKNYKKNINASIYPFAYYNLEGDYIEILENQRANPKYNDLWLNKREFEPNTIPFFTNFNLQVRKETKQGHSFSFFANNAPWHNPTYERNGYNQRLNGKLSVGLSMSFLIK